jgi:hypothetical protein
MLDVQYSTIVEKISLSFMLQCLDKSLQTHFVEKA